MKWKKRMMAFLLISSMLITGMLPNTLVAMANDTVPQTGTVLGFGEFQSDYTVENGTAQEDIGLPEELPVKIQTAEQGGGETSIREEMQKVTWEGDYNPLEAGEYRLKAAFMDEPLSIDRMPEVKIKVKEVKAAESAQEQKTEVEAQEPLDMDTLAKSAADGLTLVGIQLVTDPSGKTTVESNATLGYNMKLSAQADIQEGYSNVWIGYRIKLKVPNGYEKEALKFTDNSYGWLRNLTDTGEAIPVWDEAARTWTLEGKYLFTGNLGSGSAKEYTRSISVTNSWLVNGDIFQPELSIWLEDNAAQMQAVSGDEVTVTSEPQYQQYLEQPSNILTGWYSPSDGKLYASKSEAPGNDAVLGRLYRMSCPLVSQYAGSVTGNEKIKGGTSAEYTTSLSVTTVDGTEADPALQPILVSSYANTKNNACAGPGASTDLTYGGRVTPFTDWLTERMEVRTASMAAGEINATVEFPNDTDYGKMVYEIFVPVSTTDTTDTKRTLNVGPTSFAGLQGKSGQLARDTTDSQGKRTVAFVEPVQSTGGAGAYSRGINFTGWINKQAINTNLDLDYYVSNLASDLWLEVSAFDMLVKFDGDAFIPRSDEIWSDQALYQGGTITHQWGVLKSGINWGTENDMDDTPNEDLDFYSTLEEAQTHGRVVAILTQGRGGVLRKGQFRCVAPLKVTDDAAKAGEVCQAVLDVDIWRAGADISAPPTDSMYSKEDAGGYYQKDVWNADGSVVSGNHTYGDSLLVTGYKLTNFKAENLNGVIDPLYSDTSTYDITRGERLMVTKWTFDVEYLGEAGADPKPDLHLVAEIKDSKLTKLFDTIRFNAEYIPGTSPGSAGIIQGGYPPDKIEGNRVDFTVNGSGTYTMTLQYKLGDENDPAKDLSAGKYSNGNIYLGSYLDRSISGGGELANYAVITKSSVAGFTKEAVSSVHKPGEDIEYRLRMTAVDRQLNGVFGLDILPFNGDGRGTAITGDYTVNPLTLSVNNTGSGTIFTDMDVYYTTDTAIRQMNGGKLKSAADLSAALGGGNLSDGATALGCVWHKAQKSGNTFTIPGGKAAAIATSGIIGRNEIPTVLLSLKPTDNRAGDSYANTASIDSGDLVAGMESETAPVTTATRSVMGKAWIDANRNGAQDPGESGIPGLRVKLWLADGTEVTSDDEGNPYRVMTGADGTYTFGKVPSNDQKYYVTFEDGSTNLNQYAVTGKGQIGVADDKNSDVAPQSSQDGLLEKAVSDQFNLMTFQQQVDNKIPVVKEQIDAGFIYSYVVTFDSSGGNTTPDKQSVLSGDKVTEPAAPEKTGFDFEGWYYTDAGGAEVKWDFTADIPDKSLTLTAKWTEKSYTVQYDTQGGNSVADKTGVKFTDKNLLPSEPVKAGSIFKGWKAGTEDVSTDTAYNSLVADDTVMSITLTAQWEEKIYTVKYDTQGGGTIADKTGVHYTDKGLIPSEPEKAGYSFEGWKLGTSDTDVTADTSYDSLAADDTVMSITLTARWEKKEFTAIWKTKDGETAGAVTGGTQTETGIPYQDKPVKDVQITLTSDKGEAVLVGWDYEYIPDGSDAVVTGFTNDYKTVEVLGDITFTAKFASTPFVQTAAVNGKVTAVKGSTPADITDTTGGTAMVNYTEADNIDQNPGNVAIRIMADMHHHLESILIKDYKGHEYSFTAQDAVTGEYEVGDKTPLTKITVTFNKQEGTLLLSNIDTSLYVEAVFAQDPTYKTEFFADKDDPSSLVRTNDGLFTGNKVGEKPEADPVKPGYAFAGWSLDGTDTPDKMYDSEKEIADSDVAYYAIWTAKEYKVLYNLDGGSANPALSEKSIGYFDTGLIPSDTQYTKTGYVFDGWKHKAAVVDELTAYDVLAGAETVMSVTLKAQWDPIGYQVIYDKQAEQAEGTMAAQNFVYDTEQPLSGNAYTYPGYTFAGWAESTDGEVAYTDGQAVKNMTAEAGGTVILYAVWNADGDTDYNIEHYKQKADGTWGDVPDETEALTGETDTEVNAVPKTYTGYIYDKNHEGNILTGRIEGDGSLVLKVYYKKQLTVRFDSDGGSYTPDTQTQKQSKRAKTGDDASIMLFGVLAGLSALGATGVLHSRKRRRKEN